MKTKIQVDINLEVIDKIIYKWRSALNKEFHAKLKETWAKGGTVELTIEPPRLPERIVFQMVRVDQNKPAEIIFVEKKKPDMNFKKSELIYKPSSNCHKQADFAARNGRRFAWPTDYMIDYEGKRRRIYSFKKDLQSAHIVLNKKTTRINIEEENETSN